MVQNFFMVVGLILITFCGVFLVLENITLKKEIEYYKIREEVLNHHFMLKIKNKIDFIKFMEDQMKQEEKPKEWMQ